jgi:hypothetical protein
VETECDRASEEKVSRCGRGSLDLVEYARDLMKVEGVLKKGRRWQQDTTRKEEHFAYEESSGG